MAESVEEKAHNFLSVPLNLLRQQKYAAFDQILLHLIQTEVENRIPR